MSLQAILKRDRVLVLAGLGGATALAWTYLLTMATGMEQMPDALGEAMLTPRMEPWRAVDFVLMFVMWAVMMIGMMLPGAAPMILLFTTVTRQRPEAIHTVRRSWTFVAGYVLAWSGFSALATLLQWALDRAGLMSPMMASSSAAVGALALLAAGTYQWTPLKRRCLTHCQSPFAFLTHHWRPGLLGAFRMGVSHGLYCLGCCWLLMGLLFVVGIMNLIWIAALAAFILVEKAYPAPWVPRAAGAALVVWALAVLAGHY